MIRRIYLTFLILNFITLSVMGNQLPQRFVIEYWNHWYPFGQDGKYYTSEVFEFILQGNNYCLINSQITTKTLKNDSVYKSITKYKEKEVYSYDIIENLLNNLSNNNIPLKISDSEKRKFISQRNIRELKKVANEVGDKWFFEDLDREDIKYIKNTVSADSVFNRFIKEQINYKYQEFLTVDYCNQARLSFYYKDDSIVYDTYIDNLLAQPFIKRNKEDIDKYYFNAGINETLDMILPKKSVLAERLKLSNCKRKYLLWILDNY